MPVEQYANLATTTLSGAITAGDTTLFVASDGEPPFLFPTPEYRVRIDDEFMLVTQKDGLEWTVTREIENSVAAEHVSGAAVDHILTEGSLIALEDRFNPFKRRSPIDLADYTWDNQGTATASGYTGVVVIRQVAVAAGNDLKVLYKSYPGGAVTITTMMWTQGHGGTLNGGGLFLRQSSDGKLTGIQLAQDNNIFVQKWDSATTFNSVYTSIAAFWRNFGKPIWLRLRDDGATTRFYEVSYDGLEWDILHSVGRTDFLTPDQVAIGMNINGSGRDRLATFYDLEIE